MPMTSLLGSNRWNCALLLLALALLPSGCSRQQAPPSSSSSAPPLAVAGCLGAAPTFLRAQLRGALEADLNWSGAALACEGSARPNGEGLRISLAGPLDSSGRTLRM